MESWPSYAIEILLGNDFGYKDRISLATFLHGNGLRCANKALRLFQVYNNAWRRDRSWDIRFMKFQTLFTYLDEAHKRYGDVGDRIRSEYFYYDMNLNLTMFYDGSVITRQGERRRYFPLFTKRSN